MFARLSLTNCSGLKINNILSYLTILHQALYKMKLKVGLLGGGSWGTTVAALAAKNCVTKIWARRQETVDDININHRNELYLLVPALKAETAMWATT